MGTPLRKNTSFSTIRFGLVASDLVAVVASCALAAVLASRFAWEIRIPFVGLGARVVTPSVGVVWMASLALGGAHDARLIFAGSDYYSRVFRATFSAFGIIGLGGFAASVNAARPFILFGLPVGLAVLTGFRWMLRQGARKGLEPRRAIVLGRDAGTVGYQSDLDPAIRVMVVGRVEEQNSRSVLEQLRASSAKVLIVGLNPGLAAVELRELIWQVEEMGIEVWFDSATPFVRAGKTFVVPTSTTTLLVLDPIHLTFGQRCLKRTVDLVLGSFLFLFLFPIALVGAVAVLFSDGRPVLFRQIRVGERGRKFSIWKIRTMRDVDAYDELIAPDTKKPKDPRVFPVGGVLRRWSIDEIPQLVNVIWGSMSLVGPRPRLESEVGATPRSVRRLNAKPGLTGVWQTSGRSRIPLEEAEFLDVNYVDNWSLFNDFVLLLRTVKAVLRRDGAY